MHDIELESKYGRDTVELAKTIENRISNYLSGRRYGNVYVECTNFKMVPESNVGLFVVKFPNARPVALAGIDMTTGDYILKSEKMIPIHRLDGLRIDRLIKEAESEWASAPQKKR
jgi:hypothetical protein